MPNRCPFCHSDYDVALDHCPKCWMPLGLRGAATTTQASPVRPASRPPFQSLNIELHPLPAKNRWGYFDESGLLEAVLVEELTGLGTQYVCSDVVAGELFRLRKYEPVAGALVAVVPSGQAVATYFQQGSVLSPRVEVRDAASSPVGVLLGAQEHPAEYILTDRAGVRVATCRRASWSDDRRVHERWVLTDVNEGSVFVPLALVALLAVCRAFFGQGSEARPKESDDDEGFWQR